MKLIELAFGSIAALIMLTTNTHGTLINDRGFVSGMSSAFSGYSEAHDGQYPTDWSEFDAWMNRFDPNWRREIIHNVGFDFEERYVIIDINRRRVTEFGLPFLVTKKPVVGPDHEQLGRWIAYLKDQAGKTQSVWLPEEEFRALWAASGLEWPEGDQPIESHAIPFESMHETHDHDHSSAHNRHGNDTPMTTDITDPESKPQEATRKSEQLEPKSAWWPWAIGTLMILMLGGFLAFRKMPCRTRMGRIP